MSEANGSNDQVGGQRASRMTRASFMSRMDELAGKKPADDEHDDDQGGQHDDQGGKKPAAENKPSATDILKGAEDDIAGDGKKGKKAGDGKPPKTLKDAAERLGISGEDVFKLTVSIPVGDGAETRTLGEIKDVFAKTADLESRELAFDERRAKEENEFLRAKQEMQQILTSLPKGTLTKEMLAKVAKRAEDYRKAEGERLLEAVPDWSDDEAKATDYTGMAEHLGEYGFTRSFLDNVADHRMLKYMRDNWKRLTAVRAALKNVKEDKPGARKPSQSRGGKQPARGATRDDSQNQRSGRPLSSAQLRGAFAKLNRE